MGRRAMRGVAVGWCCALVLTAGCRNNGMPVYPEGYREFAYVANSAGNSVTVLDLVYLRQDRTLSVGAGPSALAVNPKLDEVYVVNTQPGEGAGSVSVVDAARNEVVATVPVHRAPGAIAVDPQGLRAYVTNAESNTVSVIDLKARRAIASAATGERPNGVAMAADGRSLVVTNGGSGTVSVFSPGADEGMGSSQGAALTLRATFNGCAGATSPAILPDASKVFVACSGGHQVLSIGLAQAAESWAAKQDAKAMKDRVLALMDVGQRPMHLAVKPDSGEVFAVNQDSDTVSEIAATTNEVGSTYPIGNKPAYGLVSGDGSALWVAATGTDTISLYSIDDGKFVSSLRTGSAPVALAFSADQHLLLAADARSGDVAVIRTQTKLGPALLTILPAGGAPVALAVKAMQTQP